MLPEVYLFFIWFIFLLLLTKVDTVLNVTSFPWKVFFLFQDSWQRNYISFSHYVPLGSSRVSQTFLVLNNVDGFEWHWPGFLQNVPKLWFIRIFLKLRLGWWIFRWKMTEMKFHIRGRCYQYDLSLVQLTLIVQVRLCLPGFFPVKLFSSLLFPFSIFCKPNPHLKRPLA